MNEKVSFPFTNALNILFVLAKVMLEFIFGVEEKIMSSENLFLREFYQVKKNAI